MNKKSRIACQPYIDSVTTIDRSYNLQIKAMERVKRKSLELKDILDQSNQDFRKVFFYLFANALGKVANKVAMTELSELLDLKLILKH